MKNSPQAGSSLTEPQLIEKTKKLAEFLKTLSGAQLAKAMHLSPALAKKTQEIYTNWNSDPKRQSAAVDSFIGDIYSGLQAPTFTEEDRQYANEVLGVLSGLYGIIRPLDGICPYRLEMGYKFVDAPFKDLYEFWGEDVAKCLPKVGPIVNLSSDEFSDVVTPFVDKSRLIAPKFLTVSPKTGEPTFVVIHAKIARGAFAHWLIKNRVRNVADLQKFNELGYYFNIDLSEKSIPTFVCEDFGGKGLSMKKSK